MDGEYHFRAVVAVIQPEQLVIVGMERISVIVVFVVDDFFEIIRSFLPLPVEQVDFPP